MNAQRSTITPAQYSFPNASQGPGLNDAFAQAHVHPTRQNAILAKLLSQRSAIKTTTEHKLYTAGNDLETEQETSSGYRSEESTDKLRNTGYKQSEHISPWMRNAGRKKSHPVWSFFKDLRTTEDGGSGVFCLHCTWRGDDRSPNNLKTHLKHFHLRDGVYQQFSAKLASMAIKRPGQITADESFSEVAMLAVSAEEDSANGGSHVPVVDVENNSSDIVDDNAMDSRERTPAGKSTGLTVCCSEKEDTDDCFDVLKLASNFGVPLSSTPIAMEVLAQLTTPSTVSIVNRFGAKKSNGEKKQRKSLKFKPSNVWNHFLRLSDGNVQCVHCAKILKRKDSSTKTMWGHLRAIHFKGRDWTALQQQAARDRNRHLADPAELLAVDEPDPETLTTGSTQSWLEQQVGIRCDSPQREHHGGIDEGQMDASTTIDMNSVCLLRTPTQPYIKRNRSLSFVPNGCTTSMGTNFEQNGAVNDESYSGDGLNAVRTALAQAQCSTDEVPTCQADSTPSLEYYQLGKKSLNFLSTIPHTPEVINITAGFAVDKEHRLQYSGELEENGDTECSSDYAAIPVLNSSTSASSNGQNHVDPGNHSGYNSLSSLPHISTVFSLFDGDSIVMLMRVAADLDCTLSFHCRDGHPQLCFESNCTATGKLKGSEVCLTEVNSEVRILVRNDGAEKDSEYWKKTDKTQFMWAVRGKCQKVLTQ